MALLILMTSDMYACTGIWLVSRDGSRVVARTMDHDGSAVLWGYVISPRGHDFCSRTPDGENGLRYNAVYGFVGIYADDEAFVVEGMNEAGLSAGLFRCAEHYDFDEYESSGSRRKVCAIRSGRPLSTISVRSSPVITCRQLLAAISCAVLNFRSPRSPV